MAIDWQSLTPIPIAGADLAIVVSIIDANENPVNITGWGFEVWALNAALSTDTENWSSYVTVTNAAAGVLTINLPRTLTKTFGAAGATDYNVQVWRVDGGNDGVVSTGKIHFNQALRPTTE